MMQNTRLQCKIEILNEYKTKFTDAKKLPQSMNSAGA